MEETPVIGEDAAGIIEEPTDVIDANIEAAEGTVEEALETTPEDVIDATEN